MLANMRKRAMALLLTFAMVIGMLPVSAFAAEEGYNGTVELKVGESIELYGMESAQGDEWWSDDTAVAEVTDGMVTGISAGEATVYHRYYEAVEVKVPVVPCPHPYTYRGPSDGDRDAHRDGGPHRDGGSYRDGGPHRDGGSYRDGGPH